MTTTPAGRINRWRERARAVGEWVAGFIYGMTVFEIVRHFRRQRADLEHLFVLISFGDLLGVPILPPYYSLRLLPYIVPLIQKWKYRMLRERDLTDLAADLG
ncbi:MAG TPA: hypothetical protein ENK56_03340 [Chloroflexi bacterium]|nr:hypothetical protein [Chloroflexota bacterium]